MRKQNFTPPHGRQARIALGALVAPLVAIVIFIQLFPPSPVAYGLKEVMFAVVIAYVIMGMQGFSLSLILEHAIQPRLRSHGSVLAVGTLTGALLAVVFPLVWIDLMFAARCALAGGVAGLATAALVRWHWARAAKHGVVSSVPPHQPQPIRLPLVIAFGAILASFVVLLLVIVAWFAAA